MGRWGGAGPVAGHVEDEAALRCPLYSRRSGESTRKKGKGRGDKASVHRVGDGKGLGKIFDGSRAQDTDMLFSLSGARDASVFRQAELGAPIAVTSFFIYILLLRDGHRLILSDLSSYRCVGVAVAVAAAAGIKEEKICLVGLLHQITMGEVLRMVCLLVAGAHLSAGVRRRLLVGQHQISALTSWMTSRC